MARLVLIAPGRGTYNRTELGYMGRFADHPQFARRQEILARADELRASLGRETVSALDGATSYSPRIHLPGENASALIFTCSAADRVLISPTHEVVACLGNSMGWYSTLFVAGALDFENGFRLVETMGQLQQGNIRGGQVSYPVVDESWRPDPAREARVSGILNAIDRRGGEYQAGISIRLGGFLVLAGSDAAVAALLAELPPVTLGATQYPFQLARHSAFHTPLMQESANRGRHLLQALRWAEPAIPMIDGRGFTWHPLRTRTSELCDYTLGHQVVASYDFSAALRVAIREYNPDHLVLLGPGDTLGGAIAHVIIREGWRGIHDKAGFMAAQRGDGPPLIAMNRPDQARLVM